MSDLMAGLHQPGDTVLHRLPVGAKVRLTATLKDVEEVAGGLQVTIAGVIEAAGDGYRLDAAAIDLDADRLPSLLDAAAMPDEKALPAKPTRKASTSSAP